MAETAFQKQYRQEFIAGFEQRASLLRGTVTTEAVIKGNQAQFLVADSSDDEAVTRGVNGLIPARSDNMTTPVATLLEWHDLRRKTSFNIFASQGNQREIMQMNSQAVMNRKADSDIITALQTTTTSINASGSSSVASAQNVLNASTVMANNGVPWDSNITAVVTPAFYGELLENVDDFKNRDLVGDKTPWNGSDMAWRDKPIAYWWNGMMWIVHPNLPGAGTANAECFFYHKSAIGHAIDQGGLESKVGYDEENDYSFARTTCFMGSVVLQMGGIVKFWHNDTALSTTV